MGLEGLNADEVLSIERSQGHNPLVYKLAKTVRVVRSALRKSFNENEKQPARPQVLVVLHRDGYVEVYCESRVWIKVVHALETQHVSCESLTEEELRGRLSWSLKDLYMPWVVSQSASEFRYLHCEEDETA